MTYRKSITWNKYQDIWQQLTLLRHFYFSVRRSSCIPGIIMLKYFPYPLKSFLSFLTLKLIMPDQRLLQSFTDAIHGRDKRETGYFLLTITSAPITPGTQPQSVSRKMMSTEPHPLSSTANGGKIMHRITRQIDIRGICLRP